MKILKRQYDVALNDIKGSENILTEQFYDRFKCKLFRYTVVLDESEYILDRLGMPMMTEKSQEEYDDFVRKIRGDVDNGEMHIFDCGYGVGDAELEWHI